MANGAPSAGRKPGALVALEGRERRPFDADKRSEQRENSPVTVDGVTFRRRKKVWGVSRAMRQQMRDQEEAHARSVRLRSRVAELEVEQIEVASKGDTERETELETQIQELIRHCDEATEAAELVTYRLLALLLIPPAGTEEKPELPGFGTEHAADAEAARPAVDFLANALDVEDASDLARELSGSTEPDPPETPSSGSSSD